MARTKRWTWKDLGEGIAEVHVASWKYFGDFVYQEMMNYDSYVWRGHRCDNWQLESTFERLVREAKVPDAKEHRFREKHLEQFKYAARGRRGPNPAPLDDENAWWALGQHHGLATPLLDWTTSPFVAAYFAFIDVGQPQTKNRAVFALHRPGVESRAKRKARDENVRRREELATAEKEGRRLGIIQRAMLQAKADPEVLFVRPLSDDNQRLVNQGGLFSRVMTNKTIDAWIRAHHDPDDKGYTLIKVHLPDRDRDACLRNLNRMNINHLSLFPDLQGASRFCNLFSEIAKY